MKIEDLGLSQERLRELIVNQAVDDLLSSKTWDEDGNEHDTSSHLARQIDSMVKERIDEKIAELGDKYVLPKVGEAIESIVLQETTQWGEKKGEPVSFIEYLLKRADHYMQEPVNHNGKTKKEDSYSWRSNTTTTRIAYMIDKHLQYSISTAMEKAMKSANESIVGGLEKAIKIQLSQIHQKLKVNVKV